jgi:DDE family transposase
MRSRQPWYQLEEAISEHLPVLRPAQQRGLALWVWGTILARSGCQNAVLTALLAWGSWHTLRQRLREWLYDGEDKAAPCRTEVAIEACFAPLLRWVLSWWQGHALALAIDATTHGDRLVALVVSVVYRGLAVPVAWHIRPAHQKGSWIVPLLDLLQRVRPVVPRGFTVLVLADRGLWSPRLWRGLRALRWHPVIRVQKSATFQPVGGRRQPVTHLVPGPGHAFVGRGVAFKDRPVRRAGTVIVWWAADHAEPCVVLTDLPPERVGVCWSALRFWIEVGFRVLKGLGWQWDQTRRRDPARVARHWLVLAVATLWVAAAGTRVEDAERAGCAPAHLRAPRPLSPRPRRHVGLFQRGLLSLQRQLLRGRLWRRWWLAPDPWPEPAPDLQILHPLVA